MASIVPIFFGGYSGHLIYTMTDYRIDNIEKYIETMRIEYLESQDILQTGFNDIRYLLNSKTSVKIVASLSIDFVGDLPSSTMQYLTQLSKGCLAGGMTLLFIDNFATNYNYYGKWSNAGDFVENNELLCGASMNMIVHKINNYDTAQDVPYGADWQDHMDTYAERGEGLNDVQDVT